MTQILCESLSNLGLQLSKSYDRHLLADDIKQQCCFVSDASHSKSNDQTIYKLPSAQVLTLDHRTRSEPFEILFEGQEGKELPSMLNRLMSNVPLDNRKALSQSLILAGGTTLATGFD